MKQYDVIIIGGGVIGTAIARELTRYKVKLALIEKANDIATGTTKANSAIVHAGYDAKPGTNKAIFNVTGSQLFEKVCQDLSVAYNKIGSLVVGFDETDLETLKGLKERGEINGVEGLQIITQETLRAYEPNIADEAQYALYAPSAAITEPWELAIAYMENAMDNGADLYLGNEVTGIEKGLDGFKVTTPQATFSATYIINAGGLYADTIYAMVSPDNPFTIHPRRGQYYLLDKTAGDHVKHIVFPCPSKLGKGTLVLPTAHGNLLIGPDSEDLNLEAKTALDTQTDNLDKIKAKANDLVKNLPYGETIRTFSGLRAEPNGGDFIIGESHVTYFYNVAGIKSPGLSSAPAIGVHVADEVADRLGLSLNTDFNPIREKRTRLHDLTPEAINDLIAKDKAFGKIICRCEHITEGEIVEAIHRNCGARSVNGVKRRVRPGAGRCQGGFCGPRVVEILARELGKDMTEIELENQGSYMLDSQTKAVQS